MYLCGGHRAFPAACAYARARGLDHIRGLDRPFRQMRRSHGRRSSARGVGRRYRAPGYSTAALAILARKRRAVTTLSPSTHLQPAPVEHKDVFGITFEQGRNELKFGDDAFSNIVTRNATERAEAGPDAVPDRR